MITCMGEMLIDFLPVAQGGHTTGFTMHAGGAPFNVAVGLSRLGQQVAFAGKVSTDLFGRYLRSHAEAERIDTRFLLSDAAPSTLAFVAREHGEPAYAFYGDDTADTRLTIGDLPGHFFDETSILHFGSISLLRGSTPDAVLAAAERLRGRALLSFDPNLRPGMIRDEQAYRALLDRCFALSDIVKLSVADITWLSPGWSAEEYAGDLAAKGTALVVVTRGGEGVFALRGSERWTIPVVSVQVVDTVGAGDAFSAGLLAGLSERGISSREPLESMASEEVGATLRFASVVAALTCARAGADPPRRHELGGV